MKQWYVAVEGKRYGPASLDDLRAWAAQGRFGAKDMVWSEGMAEWQPADAVEETRGLFAGAAAAAGSSVPPPLTNSQFAPGAAVRPHRGPAVLTLGIIGIFCCICGIIAWAMGSADLKEMSAGRMDRSGEGITRAGYICGIIGTILGIVGLVMRAIAAMAIGSIRFGL